MRTVYVVTTVPGARARAIRQAVALIAARIVYVLAWAGHIIVQLAGAVDAIVTALLGLPRLAFLGRRIRVVLVETWKADL